MKSKEKCIRLHNRNLNDKLFSLPASKYFFWFPHNLWAFDKKKTKEKKENNAKKKKAYIIPETNKKRCRKWVNNYNALYSIRSRYILFSSSIFICELLISVLWVQWARDIQTSFCCYFISPQTSSFWCAPQTFAFVHSCIRCVKTVTRYNQITDAFNVFCTKEKWWPLTFLHPICSVHII